MAFYFSLRDMVDKLTLRTVRNWEKTRDMSDKNMGVYRNFISCKYDGSFHVKIRDNAVSQRINRSDITVITFTGDQRPEFILSEYRKLDAMEKLFLTSKTYSGGEPLMVHSTDTLRGEMFLNLIAFH